MGDSFRGVTFTGEVADFDEVVADFAGEDAFPFPFADVGGGGVGVEDEPEPDEEVDSSEDDSGSCLNTRFLLL